jgi:hypothetical protein
MHSQEELTAFTPEPDYKELEPVVGDHRGETYTDVETGQPRYIHPADRPVTYLQKVIDDEKAAEQKETTP